MSHLLAAVVGLLAGTHIATWGMYKDAPHEGFRRYPRSIITAAILGPLIVTVVPKTWMSPGGLALLFGLTYVCERGATEFYKVFIRHEDQSKYFIPMEFHVFGRVVPPGPFRAAAAVGYALVFATAGVALQLAAGWNPGAPRWLMFGVLGSVVGWLIACGGAFKDAPIEGFEWLKFFRSPVIAGAWAALLSPFTSSYLLAALAGAGYSIATVETYKTFFFPHRPRGKFAGKPVAFPEQLQKRQRFVPLYACIWLVVIVVIVFAHANR
jgi:hypothetical protein